MKSLGFYVDEAIPHEAGHLLIGKAVGLPCRGLDVNVIRDERGTAIGDFASLAYEPPDEAIPGMDPGLRASFMLLIAGGVAGMKFAGFTTIGDGAVSDRASLARVSNTSLEEIADMAVEIIRKRKRVFRRLVSNIRQRYFDLMKNRNLQTGRHTLLTEQDLDAIFAKD